MDTQDHNLEYPEELQFLLEKLLGSENVYFQPPGNVQLKYPCIVYQLDDMNPVFADSVSYLVNKRYSLTYISKYPDQFIPDKIMALPMCSFDRFYVSDNMNHTAFRLYFHAKPNN